MEVGFCLELGNELILDMYECSFYYIRWIELVGSCLKCVYVYMFFYRVLFSWT